LWQWGPLRASGWGSISCSSPTPDSFSHTPLPWQGLSSAGPPYGRPRRWRRIWLFHGRPCPDRRSLENPDLLSVLSLCCRNRWEPPGWFQSSYRSFWYGSLGTLPFSPPFFRRNLPKRLPWREIELFFSSSLRYCCFL